MNSDVIITCAITGDDSKVTRNPHCPITPEQIATSAIEAARAGAAIVHIHVRDPETGEFSMATRHYREVVQRIRDSGSDVLVNLTCGTLNFGDGNRAYISTPDYCREGAALLRDLKVKVELEVFDTGNLWFVRQMIKEGLIPAPAMIQLCTGIPYGVPADVGHLLAMVNYLPPDCIWTSFAVSRMQMPWVAQSILLGGNVRVGLEDNLYLSRGVYA